MITFFLLGSVVAYGLVALIYRLQIHPLSKFPGPRLAAISGLYEVYFTLTTGSFEEQIEKLHEQYGPVVRITPDEVHVTSTTSNSADRWIKGSETLDSGRHQSRSSPYFQASKRPSIFQVEVHQIVRLLQRPHSHRVFTLPRFYQGRFMPEESDLRTAIRSPSMAPEHPTG
ncbi:hypothetical protein N7468_004533 [Penicillium chermesinum]|uniref:Cytochrome P450 n=1 Tax=Penicillium chermesinum TaxID=63820 RepID=A0A9W9P8H3_9EURO|nr:uncharacterized protein N7468_004533 [Penicillium chermesinum]KAJ5239914.1 hypothetical protein N7468_004533 [Penicillium chermesinum]